MPAQSPPIFIWRLWLRIRADDASTSAHVELERRLHTYAARVSIDGDEWRVAMRVTGHVGPASAIGDAAQMVTHHAAAAGFHGARIDVVYAERVSATAV